jgi:hypothetical protein
LSWVNKVIPVLSEAVMAREAAEEEGWSVHVAINILNGFDLIQQQTATIGEDIESLTAQLPGVCPLCGGPMQGDHEHE